MLSQKEYNIEKSFISNNSYICIELNARALIVLLVILRDYLPEYSSTCYAPWLLSSQPCEQTFHAARSMSNVFSTVINFGVLGLLKRLHRLQIQLNLESKSNATKTIYPRQLAHQKSEDKNCKLFGVDSITNSKIEEAVKKGLVWAKEAMEELGMKDDLSKCNQWEVAVGDVNCKIEANDGEEVIEIDKTTPEPISTPTAAEPSDDVFPTIPPDELSETVQNFAILEEKKIIKQGMKQKLVKSQDASGVLGL